MLSSNPGSELVATAIHSLMVGTVLGNGNYIVLKTQVGENPQAWALHRTTGMTKK